MRVLAWFTRSSMPVACAERPSTCIVQHHHRHYHHHQHHLPIIIITTITIIIIMIIIIIILMMIIIIPLVTYPCQDGIGLCARADLIPCTHTQAHRQEAEAVPSQHHYRHLVIIH
jgi:hypothetical protein